MKKKKLEQMTKQINKLEEEKQKILEEKDRKFDSATKKGLGLFLMLLVTSSINLYSQISKHYVVSTIILFMGLIIFIVGEIKSGK